MLYALRLSLVFLLELASARPTSTCMPLRDQNWTEAATQSCASRHVCTRLSFLVHITLAGKLQRTWQRETDLPTKPSFHPRLSRNGCRHLAASDNLTTSTHFNRLKNNPAPYLPVSPWLVTPRVNSPPPHACLDCHETICGRGVWHGSARARRDPKVRHWTSGSARAAGEHISAGWWVQSRKPGDGLFAGLRDGLVDLRNRLATSHRR